MQQLIACLSPRAMANDLEEKGSVRIHGVHFDTDEATIREQISSGRILS